jgi:hypothetical protein
MSVDASNATTAAGIDPSRARITGAIKQAAGTSGTSFQYLLATAKMESNFDPKASASTSSARGLYQFIDQTWLGTVKEAGSQLGYGQYADAITKTPSGNYAVSDPAARDAIMKLRDDPTAASSMAAALTNSNSFKLTGQIGRRPTDAELYMAHFMGVGGAAKLISNAEDNPNASGAGLFPNAAAANRSIFYDKSGQARSVSDVYSVLSSRYASAANAPATQTAMAAAGVAPAVMTVASAAPAPAAIDNSAFLSSFPVRPATSASQPVLQTASLQQNTPMFRSLFQSGERAQPVSPVVQELWGSSSSQASNATANSVPSFAARTPEVRAPQPLDLFSDRNGTFSS